MRTKDEVNNIMAGKYHQIDIFMKTHMHAYNMNDLTCWMNFFFFVCVFSIYVLLYLTVCVKHVNVCKFNNITLNSMAFYGAACLFCIS